MQKASESATKLGDILDSKGMNSQQSTAKPTVDASFEHLFKAAAQGHRMGLDAFQSSVSAGIPPLLPNMPFLTHPFLHPGRYTNLLLTLWVVGTVDN